MKIRVRRGDPKRRKLLGRTWCIGGRKAARRSATFAGGRSAPIGLLLLATNATTSPPTTGKRGQTAPEGIFTGEGADS